MTTFYPHHERHPTETTTFRRRSDRSDLLISDLLDRCPVAGALDARVQVQPRLVQGRGRDRPPLKMHTDDRPGLPPPAPHAAIRFVVPAFRAVMPMGGCHRRAQPIVLRADRTGIWVLFGSLSLWVRVLQSAPESVVPPSSHVCVCEIVRQLSRDGSGTSMGTSSGSM
jgi:hypothetical protein